MGSDYQIVFYDGLCNFCHSSVRLILRNDPNGHFKFASLQSDFAKQKLPIYLTTENFQSLVLFNISDTKIQLKSDAALSITSKLSGWWSLLSIFKILPKSLRDTLYHYIAKNRYKWFGKRESCMLPDEVQRDRFID